MKIIFIAFALIAFVGADVSHLSSNYLPPQEAGAPLPQPAPVPVGPAPSQEYIPPQQEEEPAPIAPAPIAPAPVPAPVEIPEPAQGTAADEGTEVGADGYRYKTVRRIRYRYRV